jgi:bifunctional DNase/RNase
VALVDARPSDALNLIALVPAPVFVAPEVLSEAES